MASITAAAVPVAGAALVQKVPTGVSSPVLGLPQRRKKKGGRIRCSSSEKPNAEGVSSLLGAVSVMSSASSAPAFALVDERMSTEGTGLSLGLSNNLLGWILVGVFGLIWSLYTVYTSTLEEDDDSDLSL